MFYSDTYKRIIKLLGWSYYVSYHIGLKVVFSCILLFVLCCVWQIKTIDWLAPTRAICSSSSFRASLLPARGIMYGRPQHFSRGGQWGVWRTEVPRQGPGAAPRWVSGGGAKPSEGDIFSKCCINTSSTEVLDNIFSKNTFQHFQEASAHPPAHACGHPWCYGSLDTRLRTLIPVLARWTFHLIALGGADNVLHGIHVCKVWSIVACRTRIVRYAVET